MDTNTAMTLTHKLMGAAMTTVAADDGLEALANEHSLAAYPDDDLKAEAQRVMDLIAHGGIRDQGRRELLLATLVAAQGAQLSDLRERVAHLELEKTGATA